MQIGIIGCGASGIVSAITLARKGHKVTIFEKNSQPLKKVVMSGNGKCNYFNEEFNIDHYFSDEIDILKDYINDINKKKVLKFFNGIGVIPRIKDGYYYPYSNNSFAIKSALLMEALALKVEIICDCFVENIEKTDKFILKTSKGEYSFDRVVIASGSNAYLNTDVNTYDMLANLGHRISDVRPALVPLELSGMDFKECSGVRSNALVSLISNDKVIRQEYGEVQFTNYGISGIVTMNLSCLVNDLLKDNYVEVSINLLPDIEKESALGVLNDRASMLSNRNIVCLLESIIHYKLLYAILDMLKIDSKQTWNNIRYQDRIKLVDTLFDLRLKVKGTREIGDAQVARGGLYLSEVDKNFQSKKVSGLYVCGEALDVCGTCGGYNLGFAWLSGIIVGENLC